jgi:5,5'-dehydrodivanillate O-demethylase
MEFGMLEEDGVRCFYHGWHFNRAGNIVESPYEDAVNPNNKLREQCKIKAYPVKECAGLLFAYLGPAPVPELPIWEPFTWAGGFIEITKYHANTNWVHGLENAYDPAHCEWTHDNWMRRKNGLEDAPRCVGYSFEEMPYGHIAVSVREESEPDPRSRINIWPYANFRLNSPWPLGKTVFKFFVPVDDTHTIAICWSYVYLPRESKPPEKPVYWEGRLTDDNGNFMTQYIVNQDFLSWGGHGNTSDRREEFLCSSDYGVVMMRKFLMKEIESVSNGNDAKGIIRDPEVAKCVKLFDNSAHEKFMQEGISREDYINSSYFKARFSDRQRHQYMPKDARDYYERIVRGIGD